MKKTILGLIGLCLIAGIASASNLYKVRFGAYPEFIRVVLDFDGAFTYDVIGSQQKINLTFKQTSATSQIQNYVELNDLIVRYLEIERDENNLKVGIPLAEPIKYNIFYLNDPPRLVIDFERQFLNIVSGGMLSKGVEYLKLSKGTNDGKVLAHALKIDLANTVVEPALAKTTSPNVLQSIFDFLTPWRKKEATFNHFTLQHVKQMYYDSEAIAAINGTFFNYSGEPLGALIINEEIVSCPIYDRTALFFDENNNAYIDNIFLRGYFKLVNNTRFKLTGINQNRNNNDIILYTPLWGSRTGTNSKGVEIMVQKGRIQAINTSNSLIPEDGYVISFNGLEVETLNNNLRVQDSVELMLNVIPYNTSPNHIINLVSGGPRLLKNNMIYISKNEEKFRADITKRRAARTAVGITKDKKLLLVTVQPPSKGVLGATLEELAELMQNLGAVDAMNLDGGSSTTMIVKDKTVCGNSRKVSNAIIVKPKD